MTNATAFGPDPSAGLLLPAIFTTDNCLLLISFAQYTQWVGSNAWWLRRRQRHQA